MKNLLLALVACIGLSGCVVEPAYADPVVYRTGTVEFCDDYGCRYVTGQYYYDGGAVIYWDPVFGCWIGPHGYWRGGIFYRGFVGGYHTYYHGGWYHGWGGSHYYYHGGGGHWGGHRR